MHNLASVLGTMGRREEAAAMYREALAGKQKVQTLIGWNSMSPNEPPFLWD